MKGTHELTGLLSIHFALSCLRQPPPPENPRFHGPHPLWTGGSGRGLSWPSPLVQLPGPPVSLLRSVTALAVLGPPRGSHHPHLWPGCCSGAHVSSSCPHSPTNSTLAHAIPSFKIPTWWWGGGPHTVNKPKAWPAASLPAVPPLCARLCLSLSAWLLLRRPLCLWRVCLGKLPFRSDQRVTIIRSCPPKTVLRDAFPDHPKSTAACPTPLHVPSSFCSVSVSAARLCCVAVMAVLAAHGKIDLVGQIRRPNTLRAGYRGH